MFSSLSASARIGLFVPICPKGTVMMSARSIFPARTSRLRVVGGIAITALLASALAVLSPLAASATSTSATVTVKAAGVVVDSARVEIDDVTDNSYGSYVDAGYTNTSGAISFSGLTKGRKYVIQVSVAPYTGATIASGVLADFSETWLGSTTAYTMDGAGYFVAGSTNSKTVNLKTGYSITGSLYEPTGGLAYNYGEHTIVLYELIEKDGYSYYSWAQQVLSDDTTATYTLPSLRPGKYAIQYRPSAGTSNWGAVYNGNVTHLSDVVPIDLSSNSTVDAQFVSGAAISGTVTFGGATLDTLANPYAYVSVFDVVDGYDVAIADGYADGIGHYSFSVPVGDYRVVARDYSDDASYYTMWYGQAPTFDTATTLSPTAVSPASNADIDLTLGSTIEGTVTRAGGGAISGVSVYLSYVDGESYSYYSTSTGVDGSWSFDDVAPGVYRMQFNNSDGFDPDYFYAGGNSVTALYSSATLITTASGTDTYDVEFPVTSYLDVSLLSPAGAGVANADLTLYPVVEGTIDYSRQVRTSERSAGMYRAVGLDPTLQYTVFASVGTKGTYDQYLGGGVSADEAKVIELASGRNDLTFSLAAATGASGKVVSPTGKAVKGAYVSAQYYDGSNWTEIYRGARTSSSGAWSLPNLRAGSYKFVAYAPGGSSYTVGYSGGGTDLDSAAAYYIPTGTMKTVTIKLGGGGKITGTLKGEAASPFGYGNALAVPLVGDPSGGFTGVNTDDVLYAELSGSSGKFTFAGVPAGYYVIQYESSYGSDPSYPLSYIGGTAWDTATVVKVTAGKTTTVPTWTASTTPGLGSLSGHLTGPGGVELDHPDHYSLTLQSSDDPALLLYGSLDESGDYEFTGLPTGGYMVQVDPYDYWTGLRDYEPAYFTQTAQEGGNHANFSLSDLVGLTFIDLPAINGTANVGSVVSAYSGVTNQSSDVEYQWFRQPDGPDTRAMIRGATNDNYVIQPSDYDSTLFVRVTRVREIGDGPYPFAYLSTSSFASKGIVGAGDAPQIDQDPSIIASHPAWTGTELRANPGTWDVPGVSFEYQWYADGAPISGATTARYTVSVADAVANAELSVGVIASRENTADSDEAMSAPVVAIDGGAPYVKSSPKVTKSGVSYSVSNGTWSMSGLTFSYEWFIDDVSFGTGQTFGYAGSGKLTVKVYANRDGYEQGSTTLLAKKASTAATVIDPSVVNVDSLFDVLDPTHVINAYSALTVVPGVYQFDDGSVFTGAPKYQWQYSSDDGAHWKSISKATKSTFSPSSMYLGKRLQVVLTLSSSAYGSTTDAVPAGVVGPSDRLDALGDDPTITGSPFIGRTLTAHHGTYPFSSVTYKYQWLKYDLGLDSFEPIAGKTSTSLSLSASSFTAGDKVRVQVIAHRAGYVDSTRESPEYVVGDTTIQNLTHPTMNPSYQVKVGSKVTASKGTWDVSSPTITYDWHVDGVSVKTGSSNYLTMLPAYEGAEISVNTVASKSGYMTSAPSWAGGVVTVMPKATGPAPTVVSTDLLLAGKVGVEQTVSTDVDTLFTYPDPDFSGAKLSYQWYRGSSAISGAKSSRYTPTASDVGKLLKVKVTATSSFFATKYFYSDSVSVAIGDAPSATVIIGHSTPTVQPATKLSVNIAGFPSGTSVSYKWKSSTDSGATWSYISGATKSSYTVPTSAVGKDITVDVVGKKSGYTTANLTAASSVEVQATSDIAWFEAPTLAGAPIVGTTLKINPGTLNLSGASLRYQWLANGLEIPGATASSIVPTPSLFGHTLSVQVTASKAGFTSAVATTNDLVVVPAAAPAPLSGKAPKIVNTVPPACDSHSVNYGTWSVGGLEFEVAWFAGEKGDTSSFLSAGPQVVNSNYGSRMWAQVTARGLGYTTAIYDTAAITVVAVGSCA
jgi:hypothetical protein